MLLAASAVQAFAVVGSPCVRSGVRDCAVRLVTGSATFRKV